MNIEPEQVPLSTSFGVYLTLIRCHIRRLGDRVEISSPRFDEQAANDQII